MAERIAKVERKTNETDIKALLCVDGAGSSKISTGIGFFDHMLCGFAKHGFFDLELSCNGDLNVDTHHTVEDCGIVLGQAFYNALGDRLGIARYQNFTMCMDDALVLCSVDICNRAYYESNAKFDTYKVGDFETETADEFFRSFADSAKINLHFVILRGSNAHHIIEAMFKSLAKCLKDATRILPDIKGSLSTKGVL